MRSRVSELLLSKEEILEFVREMEPTDHVVFFYERPEDKYDSLFTYLVSGIEKGYAGIYVASEEKPEIVKLRMKEYGVDVERLVKDRALQVLSYENWYTREGEVDPTYTINLWKNKLEEAKALGFKSLRATGEMSCFISYNLVNKLLEYESMLHRRLELAMMGLCAYNMRQIFERKLLKIFPELVRTHRYVIIIDPRETGVTIVI